MKLDLTGLRIEITEAMNEFVNKKIEKLAKFFTPETICHVTVAAPVKGKQHVDMRIEYKSRTYLAEEEVEDVYYGIEALVSKIEGQIRKDKTLAEKRRRENLPPEMETDVESLLDE